MIESFPQLMEHIEEASTEILESYDSEYFNPTSDDEISFYTVIYENGNTDVNMFAACHRSLAAMGGGVIAVVDGIYSHPDANHADTMAWLRYVNHESPMKGALFTPDDIEEGYDRGWVAYNVMEDANKLTNLAMANRMIHEYPEYPQFFNELVKRGVNKHLAYIFCHTMSGTLNSNEVNVFRVGPEYHTAVVPHVFSYDGVKNFIVDDFKPIGSYYETGHYLNVHNMYIMDGHNQGRPTDFIAQAWQSMLQKSGEELRKGSAFGFSAPSFADKKHGLDMLAEILIKHEEELI